jgi:hypothetical protein
MIKRMTMKFSDATHADLLWLADHLQAGNMTATIAELVHAEVRRVKGLSDDPRWGIEADAKEFLRDEKSQPRVGKKVLVEVIKPLADSIRAQELVPELQKTLSEIRAQEVAPETVVLDPIKEAQEAVGVVNNVPVKEAGAVVVDKYAEMRAAAAAKLQAQKNAPKPITGITQQA